MKKIGILGGVGPQATAYIYQSIIEQSNLAYKAMNNDDYPYVIVASVPIPDFISNEENILKAKSMLVDAAKGLVLSGCEVLCIGSNTVHILLEEIMREVNTPFLSMVELVSNECAKQNYKKVALIGTPVLISSKIYDRAMDKYGIETITPSNGQEKICDEVIRRIIAGKSIDNIKTDYVEVLNSMFEQGAESIILGCTELPMVINYEALGNRIISSDEILAKGIADYYYS